MLSYEKDDETSFGEVEEGNVLYKSDARSSVLDEQINETPMLNGLVGNQIVSAWEITVGRKIVVGTSGLSTNITGLMLGILVEGVRVDPSAE